MKWILVLIGIGNGLYVEPIEFYASQAQCEKNRGPNMGCVRDRQDYFKSHPVAAPEPQEEK